ncbi:MAG: phosphatidate cytidylyltransferase [Candidatus Bipolaricaulaceae bacterium]
MKDLRLRLLTASLAIPTVLAIFWLAWRFQQDWLAALLLSVVGVGAGWEYLGLVSRLGVALPKEAFLFTIPAFLFLLLPKEGEYAFILAFAFAYFLVIYSFSRRGTQEGFLASATGVFGLLYIPVMLGFILVFHRKGGFWHVLHFLLIVWGYDTGAYFVGSLLGRHRLLPRVSIAKTWEGVAGGLLLAGVAGLLLPQFLADLGQKWSEALIMGFGVGAFVQLGDLFESLVKRAAGVKDTGRFFPGHGGVLDRIDGILASAPVYFFLAHYILGLF